MDNLLFKSGNTGQVNIDQAQGIVECFVAGIGNKDSVGDIVISGAFAKSLTRRKPRVVWGHSWNDPIGKVLEMYEVSAGDSRLPAKMRNAGIGGLYAKVQFNLNSEKGKEAFATVAFFGEEQEWSIGYKTIDSVFDPNLQANILKEVELYEVSPVLHGANQLTGTISIKGDEKGYMPIIPMPGAEMMAPQMPRIVVVSAANLGEDESSEGNPFAEGMSQELSEPDKNALQAELAERTGSKIEVMNATENSVVFKRTTSDGKTSMYRLPYHREGSQYMFGKPEPYEAATTQPQPQQNIEQKPGAPVVVPNGGIAYRSDDQQEMVDIFGGGGVQSPWGKSDISHLIELPEAYMASARDFLGPVLRHHKLTGTPNAKGIVVDGLMTANALDALQNAVKALGTTIGQAGGNIGQAIGRIRDLAQTFNPYALDGDGDGFVQDGSAFMRPFLPIKKPGFDLPDVRGKKRSGDALLDKPRSAPKLPKDKAKWTREQRNEALLAGMMEPETREDVAFLANKRPDNEGIAKYWDMSEADLTKEGNKLVNARRQATGADKEKLDEELLKVSHEFQRRAAYAETFGQEFVPPAKREAAPAMVPEADKPKAPRAAQAEMSDEEIYNERMTGVSLAEMAERLGISREEVRQREQRHMRELRDREEQRRLDRQADDALDRALEGYIERYGEDAEPPTSDSGFASAGKVFDSLNREQMRNGEDFREWDDLDDDEKLEMFQEVQYDYLYENYGNLGDDGLVDAMEDPKYDDEIYEYAEEVYDEIKARRTEDKQRADERAEDERYAQSEAGRAEAAEDERVGREVYAAEYEEERAADEGLPSRGNRSGEFGSNPEDSKAAQVFDAILEKYWSMWGFDAPDKDDEGFDEPFGFSSRGKDEEVKQNKLDELVGGVRDRLIAELETADPATWKPSWRDDSLPMNPITGKPYRGWNAFWLMFATHDRKYGTGRYAGFNQLKERGAIVRKGEKGVPILRPQLIKKEDEDGNVKEFLVFRGATVFNIDQTDGGDESLRAIAADLPESERLKILDDTLAELGVNVRTQNMTPHYDPTGDYVSMPEFAKGTSAVEWSSTLAHETVHWTGGASRLNRPSVTNYGTSKQTRAYEELVAEIGSAMLLAAHGIEAPFRQDHAPYIKGWIQLLKDDSTALERAFKDAQAALNYMLEKSPNLRKLFGGLDNGKKRPEVDAPDKINVPVGASEGFASLHRVRTPGSEALAGILYDDNSGELMVGFLKGKSWDALSDDERISWIDRVNAGRAEVGGYKRPLSDSEIDDLAREAYEDARDVGWYVYSGVTMDDVQELAAARSKGRHINALKKVKQARKASDEDQFNFFGRTERIQDVARAKSTDGFAARGVPRGNENISITKDRNGYWVMTAMVTGGRGASEENRGTRLMHYTVVGGPRRDALKTFRDAMKRDNLSFAGEDGFASRGDALRPGVLESIQNNRNLRQVVGNDSRDVAALYMGYLNWHKETEDNDGDTGGFLGSPESVNAFIELIRDGESTPYVPFENMYDANSVRIANELANEIDRYNDFVKREYAFAPKRIEGLASRGTKRLGVEPRYQDQDWVNRTQQRILRSGLDFQSLPESDRIDWANSFLDEYLNQNEMGHNLADVSNGRRISSRPDIDLMNYAEDAFNRMSDAHVRRRAQFGEETQGLASVGRRTRRLGTKPSDAVDYVAWDPETESLFVAYKRGDGRSQMYVYEGVNSDEALAVENADSLGKAINAIKRAKNVRQATPEEVMGLADTDRREASETKKRLARLVLEETRDALKGMEVEFLSDTEMNVSDGSEKVVRVSLDPDTLEFTVSKVRAIRGGREEPDDEELYDSESALSAGDVRVLTSLFMNDLQKELDEESRIEREIDDARRELDESGDEPGVESIDVSSSSALTAVDYNPTTQELRVTYRGGTFPDSRQTYIYEGVDRATVEDFKKSPSRGRAMNEIKRAHPFRKDSEWNSEYAKSRGFEEFDVRGSEAVQRVTYDPAKEELTVVYNGGRGYVYSGVTRAEADAVRSAPSKGRAINDIKRTHDVRKAEPRKAPDFEAAGWTKKGDGKWSKGDYEIEPMFDEGGNFTGLRATNLSVGESFEQESHPDVIPDEHLENFEGILRGSGSLDDETESTELSFAEAEQYRRIARSVADAIVNPLDEPLVDPAFDRRLRGLYYPEWDVVPDWLRKNQIEWMNENNPKSSGSWTEDEVGQMFNAAREKLMNTGVKGPERKVTSGRRIPKSELDRFERRSPSEGLFDMMRKTYDSLLMSNDYDKEKANAKFAEMFDGATIEFVSDSAVLSGDVPIIDADGDRIDPQGYKIKPTRGFDQYERVMPTGAVAGVVRDPAPAPSMPRAKTQRPPRGGKRVRNRDVIISMEHGNLDEIIEAEEKGTTVDALRAISDPGNVYTKGPRKGMHRGPDTITVRDAETGELLHSNEIILTSSAQPRAGSAANRKRGYIRARSYAGRQGHNIVGEDNGKFTSSPNLRGEGAGMTDYDKRVYGLGSDEKNREYGLASRSGMERFLAEPTPQEEVEAFQNYLDSEYGEYFMEYTQMDDEELKRTLMRRYRMSRGEANQTARQIRKDENTLDDLYMAADDAGMDDDGLASRSFGNREAEKMYNDVVEEMELYSGPGQAYNGLGEDEIDRIASYWAESDALWDKYMPTALGDAEGDVLSAQALAATRAYEDYLDGSLPAYEARQERGFASRGGETEFPPLTRESLDAEIDRLIAKQQSLDTSDPDQLRQWERLEETIGLQMDRLASLPETAGNDGLASRGERGGDEGFASLSRIKPRFLEGFADGVYEQLDATDSLIEEIAYDDASKELLITPRGQLQPKETLANGQVISEFVVPNPYILENVSKEELDELGASRNLGEAVNALKEGKTVRDATDDDLFNFNGREEKIEDVETRVQLEKLLLLEQRRAKQAEKIIKQARLDLSDEEFIAVLRPVKSRADFERLMKMSPSEVAVELETARDDVSKARTRLNYREGFIGRDYETEALEALEGYRDAVERILTRKLLSRDGMPITAQPPSDGFASRGADAYWTEFPRGDEATYREYLAKLDSEAEAILEDVDANEYRDIRRQLVEDGRLFGGGGDSTNDVLKAFQEEYREVVGLTRDEWNEAPQVVDFGDPGDMGFESRGDDLDFEETEPGSGVWNAVGNNPRKFRGDSVYTIYRDDESGEYTVDAAHGYSYWRDGGTDYTEENFDETFKTLDEAKQFVRDIDASRKGEGDDPSDDDGGGLGSRGPRRGGDDEGGVALDFDEADRAAFDQLPLAEQQRRTRAQQGRNNSERRELAIQEYADEWQYESGDEDGFGSRGGRTEQIDVRGSRAVEQVTYDPEKEELLVVYNGNRGYIYEGVTRGEADALIDAPSKGSAINGIKATHSFRKATDSDVMDFDIDPAAMRQAEVDANWERLPSADKERYLRRATNAGIADGTGESADELLSAAKLRAMDDREMAMLEREAIGRGESSSRRIDVSSSSALNYVDYDEKTRTLSVEFRGRDGNGTGTLYNYQGVEPDVVDELERSDSRGATMRRIRDNYDFTTSERLPQSAYDGLASRGSDSQQRDDVSRRLFSSRLESSLNRGFITDSQATQLRLMEDEAGTLAASNALFEMLRRVRGRTITDRNGNRGSAGLASRGARRSTSDMEAEFNELQATEGMLRQMSPSDAVRYRESLIKARNQAAREMADAAGMDPRRIISMYDVSKDDDDTELLEKYDEAISDVDGLLEDLRTDRSVAQAQEQASMNALGEAQELREKARRGSLYRRRDFDSDEEFIDSMREEYDFLLGDIREFIEGESEGESRDGMETATLEHDTYVFDDEAKAFNEFKGRIASAKTEAEFDQIRADMEQLMGGLVDSFEQRYRRDEANLDYDVPSVPDQDELEPDNINRFFRNFAEEGGFSSRGGQQGRRRAPRQRWSEEDRRNFADRNFVRNRTRPGKRRQGPDAREWDGFASTGNDLEVRRSGIPADEILDTSEVALDMPTTEGITFTGGEHGPGKDISMREMWNNLRKNRNAAGRNYWFSESATANELAERLGVDLETASAILSNRNPRADEVFIDDPYLADTMASVFGYGTGQREGLFGFDPLEYVDESGAPARDLETIDAAIEADRARRVARTAARRSRGDKRAMVARGGEMTVADLERELQKIDPTIKLTNENGEPLSPGAMQRAVERSGIPIPWSVEPYRQIVKRGGVLSPNQMSDLAKFGLIQGAPARADIGASEGFQWPGFAGINSSRIFDAMAETLGISRDEVLERQPGIMRTIQENLAYARQGRRVARNMRTMRQGSIRMSRQQWKEMAERLGLDAAEFEKWFDTPIA